MRLRILILLVLLAVFGVLVTGCKTTPNKVCDHIAGLGDPRADCVAEMEAVVADYPEYWADIAVCFVAAVSVEELGTCDEVIETIRLQAFCEDVLARIPDAYRGSSANCLRAQRATMREDPARWETQRACVAAAATADEVRACPGASPRVHRIRRGVGERDGREGRPERPRGEWQRGAEGERPMRRDAPAGDTAADEAAPSGEGVEAEGSAR